MPDFSKGVRGKFYRKDAKHYLPHPEELERDSKREQAQQDENPNIKEDHEQG